MKSRKLLLDSAVNVPEATTAFPAVVSRKDTLPVGKGGFGTGASPVKLADRSYVPATDPGVEVIWENEAPGFQVCVSGISEELAGV